MRFGHKACFASFMTSIGGPLETSVIFRNSKMSEFILQIMTYDSKGRDNLCPHIYWRGLCVLLLGKGAWQISFSINAIHFNRKPQGTHDVLNTDYAKSCQCILQKESSLRLLQEFKIACRQSTANPFAALSFISNVLKYNARDERVAERRQRQSEGIDALWARGLLRKTRDQHRRSAQSHS